MKKKKPRVKLVGANGNAYNIIGLCHRAAKAAKWPEDQWVKVRAEMMAGDYDHLLRTAMNHFEVC